jgi:hypothetical protein
MSLLLYNPAETPAEQVHRWFAEHSSDDCVRALIAAREQGLLPGPRNAVQVLPVYAVSYRSCVDGKCIDAHFWR